MTSCISGARKRLAIKILKTIMKNKYYKEGFKAGENGVKWADNPYPHGSKEWNSWNNGRSDAGNKLMKKLIAFTILGKM